jgi:hypothetical protein
MILNPDTDPEEAVKLRASMKKIHQQIEDFYTLRDNIKSDNPARDAWKAVYGWDNPALDENTKEGQESKVRIAKMFGNDIDAQEKIEAE